MSLRQIVREHFQWRMIPAAIGLALSVYALLYVGLAFAQVADQAVIEWRDDV